MRQDHIRSFVPDDGGAEFFFTDPYELTGPIQGENLAHRIFSAETPGADGEYQESHQTYEPRTVVFSGRVTKTTATDLTDLQAALDAVYGAFRKGKAGKLYRKIVDLDTGDILSSRYLRVRVAYRDRGEEVGLPTGTWSIGFRSIRSLYYEDSITGTAVPRSVNLSTANAGVANVTAGGVEWVRPKITLVVSAPGTITLTPGGAASDQPAITLEADVAGTYILDSDGIPPSATKAGLSVLSAVSGGFFSLPPEASTITTTLAGGAALTSGLLEWRRCYPFAT